MCHPRTRHSRADGVVFMPSTIVSSYQTIITFIRNNPLRIGIAFFVLAIILRLCFTWISLTHLPVTSDEASSVLLAKMIARGALPLLFLGQPYQFPIESYLMSPLVELVPRTPLGARYQQLVFGFIGFLGFLAIARSEFPRGSRWPTLLLLFFPSAYFLVYLSAYAPPQYSVSLTLAWVSIYCAVRANKSNRRLLLIAIAGLCCGLAVSNHLLTITISVGVFLLILFPGSRRLSLQGIAVFIVCCILGALPYILAHLLIPGAYKNLPSSVTFIDGLSRLVNPALTQTLPGAMGVNPILFPDLQGHVKWPASLRTLFALFYLILFVSLTAQRLWRFLIQLSKRQWPRLEIVDLALVGSLLSLWVFASHNTAASSYRYVLPAVWCFPFLIGHAYRSWPGRFCSSIGCIAIVLALFNIGVTLQMMIKWSNADQLERYALSPRIDPLLEMLHEKEITHCYASFWLAYRITYETDEQIICSLPYNQRFPLWPIPYKAEVDNRFARTGCKPWNHIVELPLCNSYSLSCNENGFGKTLEARFTGTFCPKHWAKRAG